jgi:hypothetical protein
MTRETYFLQIGNTIRSTHWTTTPDTHRQSTSTRPVHPPPPRHGHMAETGDPAAHAKPQVSVAQANRRQSRAKVRPARRNWSAVPMATKCVMHVALGLALGGRLPP